MYWNILLILGLAIVDSPCSDVRDDIVDMGADAGAGGSGSNYIQALGKA